jgi:hypothetical protein
LCRSFVETIVVLYEDVGRVEGFSELKVIIVGLLLVFVVEGGSHGRKAVVVDDVLPDFSDVCLLLSKSIGTYPVCSLGALEMIFIGILCLLDINWRKEMLGASSNPRVMKELRNFLSLMEFLVWGFFRFMKWSNIMHLSYASSSSLLLIPWNRLLTKLKSTRVASGARRPRLRGTACSRGSHRFSKIRFGA